MRRVRVRQAPVPANHDARNPYVRHGRTARIIRNFTRGSFMACERIDRCPLFKHFSLKSSLLIWTTAYCKGDYQRCERLRRATAGIAVPSHMLPNGKLLAVPLEQAELEDTGAA